MIEHAAVLGIVPIVHHIILYFTHGKCATLNKYKTRMLLAFLADFFTSYVQPVS
jgi:hypothetical protein